MKNILLSFDVEEFDMPLEYGQVISLSEQMDIGYEGLEAIAPILHEVQSTLFTTAYFADHFPAKIISLSETHEIASHTYYHSSFAKNNLLRSKIRLEEITKKEIYGLRMPRMNATSAETVLEAGYMYDASIHPTWLPGRYNNWHLSRLPYTDHNLFRIPASVTPKWRIPLFWLSFKCFPYSLYRDYAIRTLEKDGHLSLYFHPWEFTDLSNSKLPSYTRRICGDRLVERLVKLIFDLSKYGTFTTMASFANIHQSNANAGFLKKSSFQEITSHATTQGRALSA